MPFVIIATTTAAAGRSRSPQAGRLPDGRDCPPRLRVSAPGFLYSRLRLAMTSSTQMLISHLILPLPASRFSLVYNFRCFGEPSLISLARYKLLSSLLDVTHSVGEACSVVSPSCPAACCLLFAGVRCYLQTPLLAPDALARSRHRHNIYSGVRLTVDYNEAKATIDSQTHGLPHPVFRAQKGNVHSARPSHPTGKMKSPSRPCKVRDTQPRDSWRLPFLAGLDSAAAGIRQGLRHDLNIACPISYLPALLQNIQIHAILARNLKLINLSSPRVHFIKHQNRTLTKYIASHQAPLPRCRPLFHDSFVDSSLSFAPPFASTQNTLTHLITYTH